jgi:integrase-like protein
MPTLLSVCLALGRAIVMPRATLILENAALRHHDNDAIYGQYRPSVRVVREGRPCRYRCHLDRWLHEVIAITGIPIPYGAPNASPHVERFMRTLREEALDHFLFLSVAHLRRVVNTYVAYYNGARPSQAIHAIPAPYPELRTSPSAEGTLIVLPVLGGLHHDYRLAA